MYQSITSTHYFSGQCRNVYTIVNGGCHVLPPHFDRGLMCVKMPLIKFVFTCLNNSTRYLNKIKQSKLMGLTDL